MLLGTKQAGTGLHLAGVGLIRRKLLLASWDGNISMACRFSMVMMFR
jgi:hypothetical protein